MLVAGLTGGIASGKSTVGAMFKELGAYVIEADYMARRVLEPPSTLLQKIAGVFGSQVLNAQGQLKRDVLREIIFNDAAYREKLNSMMHPAIREAMEKELRQIAARNAAAIILLDIPLLYEIGWDKDLKPIILVYASPQKQMERLMHRDNAGPAQARAALNAQMPIDKKRDKAHFIIDNSGSLQETFSQVRDTWRQLQTLSIQKSS